MGATGYSGMELSRILSRHPNAELLGLYSSPLPDGAAARTEGAGSRVDSLISSKLHPVVAPFDAEAVRALGVDIVYFATPNEISNEVIPALTTEHFKIIDLSGGFRLQDASLYPRWYGFNHAAPGLLAQFIYGLPELNGAAIRAAQHVANPGCYATSALLPLLPLVKAGWIDDSAPIVCDSKSGVSGAGKQPTSNTHFCEVSESFKAYSVFSHRHLPEIEAHLGLNGRHKLLFTPHLLPINRGILSTLYLKLKSAVPEEELRQMFREFYARAPFIRVFPEGELPQVKWVTHTNFCDIGLRVEENSAWVILVSCIDNLVKGAAGQAVQNMNLMFGLEESAGLN